MLIALRTAVALFARQRVRIT